MERKKKNSGLILISVLLIMLGTVGIVFATGDTTPDVQTAVESTTFSAIMTSPAVTGTSVTDPVDVNNASFSFTFSEPVKNNGLNAAGMVTVTKVSGGSQAVASDGAIVASAVAGDNITFTNMGTAGSTTTTFTVAPAVLETEATYQLKLSSGVPSNTVPVKTLGEDVLYTFTTAAAPTETTATFSAISLYPVNGVRDVAVDADFVIGFNEAILNSNNITGGKAIELVDTLSATTLPAVFTVSDDLLSITINPVDNLAYGKDYQLKIVDGKIKNADESSALSESLISFRTTSFSQVSASAATTGAGLDITINLTNASAKTQKVTIAYVVRRDKGARLEDGGTVVVNGTTLTEISCLAGQTTVIPVNITDITVDQFGNTLSRGVFVDIFVINSNGDVLFDPIHAAAQQI